MRLQRQSRAWQVWLRLLPEVQWQRSHQLRQSVRLLYWIEIAFGIFFLSYFFSRFLLVSYFTAPIFTTNAADMYFTLRVCGLEASELVVVRFDVQIYCLEGSTPTGNLQGQFIDAYCDDGTHLRGGKQTIPLKNVNRIAGVGGNCTPNDGSQPITGPDFSATVTIYSPQQTNGVRSDRLTVLIYRILCLSELRF